MPDRVATLKVLDLLSQSNCSLSHMPTLSGMSRLFSVFVPHNRLSKLDGLMNPYYLWLHHNLFTEFPTLTEPEKISRLAINYNPVKDITRITSFTYLTDDRLSNTEISFVSLKIHEILGLYFLGKFFSKMITLHENILKVAKLYYLVIYGHPFSTEEIASIKADFKQYRPDVQLLI